MYPTRATRKHEFVKWEILFPPRHLLQRGPEIRDALVRSQPERVVPRSRGVHRAVIAPARDRIAVQADGARREDIAGEEREGLLRAETIGEDLLRRGRQRRDERRREER